jgi:hypothetical protein
MSPGRAGSRTAEWRDKVGNLRRGGRSRERAFDPSRLHALKGSGKDQPEASCRRKARAVQAHESCAASNAGRAAGGVSLERRKPRRASGLRWPNPPLVATDFREDQGPEGERPRLPLLGGGVAALSVHGSARDDIIEVWRARSGT